MPRKALFAFTICLLTTFIPIIKAEPTDRNIYCPNETDATTPTYAQNSTYQTNLNTLLSVLSSNSNSSNGFYNFTAGTSPPDVAYGLFLCRGDVTAAVCQDCVVFASTDAVTRCPGSKRVTILYEECFLWYSNVSIFSDADARDGLIFYNRQNVTNATRLREVLGPVMDDIVNRASSDDSGKKFATAKANYTALEMVYGLAQCTPDLSDSDCKSCLRLGITGLIDTSRGSRVLFPSCYVRFEMYEFYNTSFGAAPPPPSPVLPPSTTPPSSPVYGLGQCIVCTPDLSYFDCNNCLRNCVSIFPGCCAASQGARVLHPSRYVHYEMYPFYNNSVAASPLPLSSLRPPPSPTPSSPGKMITIIVSISASVVLALLGSGIYYQRRRKRTAEEVKLPNLAQGRIVDDYSTENLKGEKPTKSHDFPSVQLGLLLVATKNFSQENKLGEGGFGPVYKGTLPDGKEIAIKRLSRNSGQGLQEFKNEITLISRLQHRNLVRLLGCCLEGNELMLIYEYMPNKSLDFFLFDSTKAAQIDWKRRFLIINGIARGLLYLHEDSRLRIIHRDLKVSNILLDQEMNPKISDFGMARIFGGNQSEANTNRVVGTYGYMAPEYAMEGQFSVKSDVFSFGVLLLEIISGKKNNGFYLSEQGQSLLTYAWNLWCKGDEILELMDPLLMESRVATEVLKCIHIGLLCVQEDPADRPTMSTIVATLVSDNVTLPQPAQPAFSVGRSVLKSCQSSQIANIVSQNEITISDVSPQ